MQKQLIWCEEKHANDHRLSQHHHRYCLRRHRSSILNVLDLIISLKKLLADAHGKYALGYRVMVCDSNLVDKSTHEVSAARVNILLQRLDT